MLKEIPFKQLVASPINVRTLSASKHADVELIMSIKEVGVLQNLVVAPTKKNAFEVVAGGRRFAALKTLVREKKLPGDYAVPCRVMDTASTDVSLLENVQREAMHPADEFMAYQAMIDEGHSVESISQRFHTTSKQVQQRLKLANVAPTLIDLFKQDKLSFECVMAFTVCDDHERQLACYKQLSRGYMGAHQIRQLLTDGSVRSDSPLARYVTLNAYTKAGGSVSEDLFQETVYIEDAVLLREIAERKLQKAAAKVGKEGWKWVVATPDNASEHHSWPSIDPEPMNVPDALQQQIAEAKAVIDELEHIDVDQLSDEDRDAKEDELIRAEEHHKALIDKLDDYLDFAPAQKALAGAVVTIGHNGKLLVRRGLVRRADIKAMRALQQPEGNNASAANTKAAATAGESDALLADLAVYRAQVVRASVTADPTLAVDLLHFTLCDQFYRDTAHWSSRSVDVTVTPNSGRVKADDLETTVAGVALTDAHGALSLDWCKPKTEAKRFAAFCALKPKAKTVLLAYIAGQALEVPGGKLAKDKAVSVAVKQTAPQIAAYWRPNKANYLDRLRRDDLLTLGGKLLGKDWETKHSKAKKSELVSLLDNAFNDEDTPLTNEQTAALDTWLPGAMTL